MQPITAPQQDTSIVARGKPLRQTAYGMDANIWLVCLSG
jgi:hypothetical protein